MTIFLHEILPLLHLSNKKSVVLNVFQDVFYPLLNLQGECEQPFGLLVSFVSPCMIITGQ